MGDSICGPIDMVKFENGLDRGTSCKRCFSGATVSRLGYYIEGVLKEDIPDKIILCMGTNNLTKKRQSDLEIAKEIIDVVNSCYNSGVNDVFVSGITIRPGYDERICQINRILERNANIHNYEFIDNSNILEWHLRGDGLHLNKDGTILLANNYLKTLNRRSLHNAFY